ncbi:MAG: hypothetical protein M1826_001639 [Phylliscum demangeonii]|nr:MAG: hypothetical protein M1826_001639 [Phylliscum demangeonii]
MARKGRDGKPFGLNVPWAYDPDIKPDYKPSELFPAIDQYPPSALTAAERAQVARFRAFRARMHDGPLYTILGGGPRAGQQGGGGGRLGTVIDPFEGMPTYTQKYKKKTRKIPRLDTRPYDYDRHGEVDVHGGSMTKKRKKDKVLTLAGGHHDDENDSALPPQSDDENAEETDKGVESKTRPAKDDADDEETAKGVEDDDDAEDDNEQDQDDEFDEQDEDMGDDYNAENYFETGEEEIDDGGGGGADEDVV